tara:strand:+ start:19160 stop:19351 length:192 start_codon:yes stop_codon:yes gene_type:complete
MERYKVVHSQSKNAWNIVGTIAGGKYKIARCPYDQIDGSEEYNTREKYNCLINANVMCAALNK